MLLWYANQSGNSLRGIFMSNDGKLKRVRLASRKDPLIDPKKLRSIGVKASTLAKKKAFSQGVSIATVRDGAVVRVSPNGQTEVVKRINRSDFPRLEDDLCLG